VLDEEMMEQVEAGMETQEMAVLGDRAHLKVTGRQTWLGSRAQQLASLAVVGGSVEAESEQSVGLGSDELEWDEMSEGDLDARDEAGWEQQLSRLPEFGEV
jgi:hypothetical protein